MANLTVWENYKRTMDPQTRDRMLKQYLPLVKNVASRMALGFPKSVELNDLVNTGVIGLIEAFNNFDPARGVKFETYAVPRIRGAILDELRALDGFRVRRGPSRARLKKR
jgi:RNA polymerase sigma factor for flagellar operon FliA